MISVIVCSINPSLARQVQQSIEQTIGVEWEFILLDNTILKKGIGHIYNLGASRAKYDILCFVHEDVLFETAGWGGLLSNYFSQQPELGLVGIAGAKYKSRILSGWSTGIPSLDCCNIVHRSADGSELRLYTNPEPGSLVQEVVTIDGVFMCARKEAWGKTGFNDQLLDAFHLYDIDFSFAIAAQYRVIVSFEIDLIHLTEGGSFGDQWLKYTLLWHRFHAKKLPVHKGVLTVDIKAWERFIRKSWLNRLSSEKIAFANKLKWIIATKSILYIGAWPYIMKFLIFRNLKRAVQLFRK